MAASDSADGAVVVGVGVEDEGAEGAVASEGGAATEDEAEESAAGCGSGVVGVGGQGVGGGLVEHMNSATSAVFRAVATPRTRCL